MLKTLRTHSLILAGAASAAFVAAPALAHDPQTDAEVTAEASNGEWLSLTGSVTAVAADGFMLDYGSQTIRVEMDDYDWFDEKAVMVGDEVIVSGRMDADFWENRKVEASSVYVESRNAMYFASSADEEGASFPAVMPVLTFDPLTAGESVSLTGTVAAIDDDEMVLDAGLYEYKVDVGEMAYDPFDNDGFRRIAVGERVSVYGRMDSADLFDTREIDAMSVVEIG